MKGEPIVEPVGPSWRVILPSGGVTFLPDVSVELLAEQHRNAQAKADALLALIMHKQRSDHGVYVNPGPYLNLHADTNEWVERTAPLARAQPVAEHPHAAITASAHTPHPTPGSDRLSERDTTPSGPVDRCTATTPDDSSRRCRRRAEHELVKQGHRWWDRQTAVIEWGSVAAIDAAPVRRPEPSIGEVVRAARRVTVIPLCVDCGHAFRIHDADGCRVGRKGRSDLIDPCPCQNEPPA